jgi:hypothetical protein
VSQGCQRPLFRRSFRSGWLLARPGFDAERSRQGIEIPTKILSVGIWLVLPDRIEL